MSGKRDLHGVGQQGERSEKMDEDGGRRMKRDEKRKYRLIPETAEEQMSMIGYDQGFNDGYVQALYDNMPEDMKKDLDEVEKGLFAMFNLFGKKEDK